MSKHYAVRLLAEFQQHDNMLIVPNKTTPMRVQVAFERVKAFSCMDLWFGTRDDFIQSVRYRETASDSAVTICNLFWLKVQVLVAHSTTYFLMFTSRQRSMTATSEEAENASHLISSHIQA